MASSAVNIGSGSDIHERKTAGETLRATRDQISSVPTGMGVAEGVTVHDAAGKLVFANAMAAQLLGYPTAEALLAAPPGEAVRRFEVFDEHGQPFPLTSLPGRRALQGEPEPSAQVRFRLVDTDDEHWSKFAPGRSTTPMATRRWPSTSFTTSPSSSARPTPSAC